MKGDNRSDQTLGLLTRFLLLVYVVPRSCLSQCSEGHRALCFRKMEGLGNLYDISGLTSSSMNVTAIAETCILYLEFRDCSIPFLDICEDEFVAEMEVLDGIFNPICVNIEVIRRQQECFDLNAVAYGTCAKNRDVALSDSLQQEGNPGYTDTETVCRLAQAFSDCMYDTTRGSCSADSTELVQVLVQSSNSVVRTVAEIECDVRGPTNSSATTLLPEIHSRDISTDRTPTQDVTSHNIPWLVNQSASTSEYVISTDSVKTVICDGVGCNGSGMKINFNVILISVIFLGYIMLT